MLKLLHFICFFLNNCNLNINLFSESNWMHTAELANLFLQNCILGSHMLHVIVCVI